MARATTLNVRNLESLGARRLAELLLEATSHDVAAKRSLRLELAAKKGPKEVASLVRQRLGALRRARQFVPRSRAVEVAHDLDLQREAIQAHVAADAPAVALSVLWRFMELAEPVFDRVDDSYGLVGDVFREALSDLGAAAAAARPDPVKLAEMVFDVLWPNDFGQYGGVIGHLAPALGDRGLEHLKQRVLAVRSGKGGVERGENGNVVKGPWRQPGRDRASGPSEYAIRQALKDIADAQENVDAFIAEYDEEDLSNPAFTVPIARRLLAADRPAEALQFLDGAQPREVTYFQRQITDWEQARIDALEALGRDHEAQAGRWEGFGRSLDARCLREYLERLPDSEVAPATERALAIAVDFPAHDFTLDFLLEWRDLPGLARVVLSRAPKLDGANYRLLNRVAAALGEDHPLSATLALRAMIDDTLRKPRRTRYRHAARHLVACEEMSSRITDYRGFDDHATFLGELIVAHSRKRKFWSLVAAEVPEVQTN